MSQQQISAKKQPLGPLYLSLCALLFGFSLIIWAQDLLPTRFDVEIYYQYAGEMLQGKIPFVHFYLEYPPFALPFFYLPGAFNHLFGWNAFLDYMLTFEIFTALLAFGIVYFAWKLLGEMYPGLNRTRRMGYITFAMLLNAVYVLQRFDIAVSFLVALSLYLLSQKRAGWGGFVLGLGVAAKLSPGVMYPIFALNYWYAEKSRSKLIRLTLGVFASVTITVLPFVIVGWDGLMAFLKFHTSRGIEVESIYANIACIGQTLGLTQVTSGMSFNSINLITPWEKPLLTLSSLLLAGGLLYIYWLVWRDARRSKGQIPFEMLVQASALATMWFILSNKVISPQYLVWLLPFCVFWGGAKIRLFLAASAVSFIPYPLMANGTLQLDWQPMTFIIIRNALLIALFYLVLRDYWKNSKLLTQKPAEVQVAAKLPNSVAG